MTTRITVNIKGNTYVHLVGRKGEGATLISLMGPVFQRALTKIYPGTIPQDFIYTTMDDTPEVTVSLDAYADAYDQAKLEMTLSEGPSESKLSPYLEGSLFAVYLRVDRGLNKTFALTRSLRTARKWAFVISPYCEGETQITLVRSGDAMFEAKVIESYRKGCQVTKAIDLPDDTVTSFPEKYAFVTVSSAFTQVFYTLGEAIKVAADKLLRVPLDTAPKEMCLEANDEWLVKEEVTKPREN